MTSLQKVKRDTFLDLEDTHDSVSVNVGVQPVREGGETTQVFVAEVGRDDMDHDDPTVQMLRGSGETASEAIHDLASTMELVEGDDDA